MALNKDDQATVDRSHLDQEESFLRDFAKVVFTYFDSLKKSGFEEDVALLILRDWHRGRVCDGEEGETV